MSNIFLSPFLSEKYGRPIFLVDETKNPTGSHKDRSFGAWLKKIKEEGSIKELVISSSGNAAAAAAYFAGQFGLSLHIFLSEKIIPDKLEQIKKIAASHPLLPEEGCPDIMSGRGGGREKKNNLITTPNPLLEKEGSINIKLVARPKFEAAQAAQKNGWFWLRSSVNDDALLGYESLAEEIEEKVKNPGSIFIPSSSGTLAVGLHKFLKIKPAFHLVQTTAVNTLVRDFDQDFVPEKKSLAGAIVDLIGQRRSEVVEIIKSSGGFGWAINNDEIKEARAELFGAGIECSYTSALGLAGLKKAQKKNFEVKEPIVILIT
jgi:threonine synthase